MRITMLIIALLIGGLIGAGVSRALNAAPAVDAGDWLAFAGALVGVVVTILGTLWLDHYRSAHDERTHRKLVTDVLNEIEAALENASDVRGDSAISEARPARIKAEEELLRTFGKFVYARHYIPHRDIDCWYAFEELNSGITRERSVIEREVQIIRDAGDNEAVFGVNIAKMMEVADRLSPLLATAKTEIRD